MTVVGRYVLKQRIAQGGMGEVFEAVARGAGGFEKRVVVKRILPQLDQDAHLAAMFVAEANVMSRLAHPNIVQVLDFGIGDAGAYFLVMELVDGVDLGALAAARGGRLEPGLAARVILELLRGLRHAHEVALEDGRAVVHRDVSPGNVLLSRVGEVKVADFGVALVSDPRRARPSGEVAGKLGYMAPEQQRGEAVDARADVYATGVVLYRLLTGCMPPTSDGSPREGFVAPSSVRPEVPSPIEAVVMRALASSPDERFASARSMGAALQRACDASGIALPDADQLAEAVREAADASTPRGEPAAGRVTRVGDRFTFELTPSEDAGHVIGSGTDVGSVIRTSGPTPGAPRPEPDRPRPTPPAPPHADEAEPPLEPPLEPSPAERSRPRWRVAALAVAGVAVAMTMGFGLARWLGQTGEAAAGDGAPVADRLQGLATSAPGDPASPAEPAATVPRSPPGTSATAPSSGPLPAPQSSPRPTAPPSPTPPPWTPPSTPPTAACQGKVLLAAKGSWWVSGGPARVQAPGQYQWPCGSYALLGTSRADGRTASRSLQVTAGGTAATRFE